MARHPDLMEVGLRICRAKNCIRRGELKRKGLEREMFRPVEEFRNPKGRVVTKCQECQVKQRIAESRRGSRERDVTAYEAKPKTKAIRKAYEAKPENKKKALARSQKYRAKQYAMNREAYVERCTELHREWVVRNPGKIRIYNQKKREDYQEPENKFKAISKHIEGSSVLMLMSQDEFVKHCVQPCYYCGIEPYTDESGKKITNGVDKISIYKHYCDENTCSCCKLCNISKCCLDRKVFIMMVLHIASRFNLIELNIVLPEIFLSRKNRANYSEYVNKAKKRNINFELTREQFDQLINGKCYYTNISASDTFYLGIDRIDSSKGYVFENCCPATKAANYIKHLSSMPEFLARMKAIASKHIDFDLYDDFNPTESDCSHIVSHL